MQQQSEAPAKLAGSKRRIAGQFLKGSFNKIKGLGHFVKDKQAQLHQLRDIKRQTDLNASFVTSLTNDFRKELGRDGKLDQIPLPVFRNVLPRHITFGSEVDLEMLFNMMDVDGDGFVSVRDVCSVLSIIAKGSYEDKLKFLFRMYDSDGTGVLTANEVEALLHFIAERIVHWTGADSEEREEALATIERFTEQLLATHNERITLDDWVNSGIRVNALQPILQMLQISDHSLRAKAARNLDIKEKINYPQFDKWVEKHIPMKHCVEEAEQLLHTGDLLLFSGGESFSRIIKKATWSVWSHSALIIKDPTPAIRACYGLDPNSKVFVFESDSVTVDNRKGGGVQMVPLRDWLKIGLQDCHQDGRCVIRQLKLARPETLDNWSALSKLEVFICAVQGSGYEKHLGQLIQSMRKGNKSEDLTTIFCSELVAAAYIAMGWLSDHTPSNNYVPADFSSERSAQAMVLEEGATLAKEIRIFYLEANMHGNDKAYMIP